LKLTGHALKGFTREPRDESSATLPHKSAKQPQQASVEWRRLQDADGEVYMLASYRIRDETKCTCAALLDAVRRRTLAGSKRRTRK